MAYSWTAAANYIPGAPAREPAQWVRVSRLRCCPVCGKPDWCSVTDDGTKACCMRVADGAVAHVDQGHGRGHIHVLNGQPARLPTPYVPPMPSPPQPAQLDYEAILERWRALTPPEALDDLAAELGVERASLERLDVTYCPERQAWAFPMHDERRHVLGIRLRAIDGGKFALNGSRAGAFIPFALDSRPMLLICEGPTDTAAALTLDFHAIGRPSCTGATGIICDMLQAGRRRDVVIVADADGPGRAGAKQLADRIFGLCRTVKVISAAPHKDLRAWLRVGATAELVQLRIDNACFHNPEGP